MKKIICFGVLMFSFVALFAQKENLMSSKDTISSLQDTNYLFKEVYSPAQYNISMGAGFGTGFFGERFASTYIAPSIRIKVNEKAYVRAGILTGDTWVRGNSYCNRVEDRAPYSDHYKRTAAYMGMDIELNPNLNLSVTAFYDVSNPMSSLKTSNSSKGLYTYGFNANMTYEITKNSFLNLSFTYIESNNPYSTMLYNGYGLNPMGLMHNSINPYNNIFYNNSFGW
jgi:hypothetical protein